MPSGDSGVTGDGQAGGSAGLDGSGVNGAGGADGAAPVADGGGTLDAPVPLPDSGTPSQCSASGATCTMDLECCSRLCDPTTKTCWHSIALCSEAGASCSVSTDCCTLSCVNGMCAATACKADGQACAGGPECCSGTCVDAACKTNNTSGCKTGGNPCGADSECCSRLCKNGSCALGSSYCIQPDDVCYRSTDCCSGFCDKAAGAAAGVCKTLATTGSGMCTQDGVVCGDCTTCCSRLCAPFALSGVKICQPASGCKITSNLCQKDSDCCGGDPMAQMDTSGHVQCSLAAGVDPPLGACRNPTGCQARGNVCGKREGDANKCGGNAREDCCDCPAPKFNCCKPDPLGVYRCFGGGTQQCPSGYTGTPPCCIAAGERCQFSAECCDGTPCVPDQQGALRCLSKPPEGVACVARGGACTTTGDCCTGLFCNVAPGQTFGTCGDPALPPGTGGVGGMSGTGGTGGSQPPPPPPPCAFHGQACGGSINCCSGLTCLKAGTNTACDGTTSCVCSIVVE
jgi:hypothetical protein